MGRTERRKQERKNKNNKINNEIKEYSGKDTIITTIRIIITIALILLALYFVVAIFITKEIDFSSKDNDTTTETASTVSDKILAKNTFNQKEETYYVYFYDFNDEDNDISSDIYNINDKVYRVDTSSSLNKNYVTEEETGNKNATSIDNLKVINPTLIKVSNDKITEYYETVESIVSYLEK